MYIGNCSIGGGGGGLTSLVVLTEHYPHLSKRVLIAYLPAYSRSPVLPPRARLAIEHGHCVLVREGHLWPWMQKH